MNEPARLAPILAVDGLRMDFPVRRGLLGRMIGAVHAVADVGFEIGRGETLGLVGESGCGKSTVGRLIMRLLEPTAGRILLAGTDVSHLDREAMRPLRRRLQMVFQDPYASLNPRLRVGEIVGEPLENFEGLRGAAKRDRVAELLGRVGLRPDAMDRFAFEFSGGQRQRLAIARALGAGPSLIVADEPVSALDVSVQAQVLNLMVELQATLGLAYLFISHDLAVVEHVSDRVAVMYLGRLVELAPTTALFDQPRHPYTQALLDAAPVPDPTVQRRRTVLQGEVPSPMNPPAGCQFHTRCPHAEARCRVEPPPLLQVAAGRSVACHLHKPLA